MSKYSKTNVGKGKILQYTWFVKWMGRGR